VSSWFTFDKIFRRRWKIFIEQSLNTTLRHSAVSNQIFIHLPFYYPLSKPHKLIMVRNAFITQCKIVKTVSTMITLFIVAFTFLNNFRTLANRTFSSHFWPKKRGCIETTFNTTSPIPLLHYFLAVFKHLFWPHRLNNQCLF
jgi:hypothetical protein